MEKILVVYQSHYGFTQKYAQWIASELSCELVEEKLARSKNLNDYDIVVYGGGLYAGGVSGIRFLTKRFTAYPNLKWVLFTCGLADPKDEENVAHIRQNLKKVLTDEMIEQIPIFHFRGGMDYAKMGFIHKAMMTAMYQMMRKKDPAQLKEEDRQFLETYGKSLDFTEQTAIEPLIQWVWEQQEKED